MGRMIQTVKLSVALLLLGATGAWANTINFDNVADGTVIDSSYTGVTFSCFSSVNACNGANSGSVYARSSLAATSAPNIVSTIQTGVAGTQDSTSGAIEVHFDTAQTVVSIDDILFQAPEGLGSAGYGYLQAYDSSLHFLGEVDNVYGGNSANLGVSKTLSLTFAGNISYLLLGDIQGSNIISAFDNLCYSTDATGCVAGGGNTGGGNTGGGGTGVPEPGTWLLMVPGLAALVGTKFRKAAVRAF